MTDAHQIEEGNTLSAIDQTDTEGTVTEGGDSAPETPSTDDLIAKTTQMIVGVVSELDGLKSAAEARAVEAAEAATKATEADKAYQKALSTVLRDGPLTETMLTEFGHRQTRTRKTTAPRRRASRKSMQRDPATVVGTGSPSVYGETGS